MAREALQGMADLQRKLSQLADPKENAKALRAAAAAGMRVVLREARATVPRGNRAHRTYKGRIVAPGFASRNLRVVSKLYGGTAVVKLGPRKEAFYATQFIELGTARMPARPWLVPAMRAKQGEALVRMSAVLRKRTEAIARKRGFVLPSVDPES